MKKIYLTILFVLLNSCDDYIRQKDNYLNRPKKYDNVEEENKTEVYEDEIQETTAASGDTIIIKKISASDTIKVNLNAGIYGTVEYFKGDIRRIFKSHPEFYFKTVMHPDSTYDHRGEGSNIHYLTIDNQIKGYIITGDYWDSPTQQDEYYFLYAYYLKKKINRPEFDSYRKKIASIRDINESIQSLVCGGGTLYFHNSRRIPAYLEYEIYEYIRNNKLEKLDTTVDNSNEFQIRKKSYVDKLKKKYFNELNENFSSKYEKTEKDKKDIDQQRNERAKELKSYFKEFSKNIVNDNFIVDFYTYLF